MTDRSSPEESLSERGDISDQSPAAAGMDAAQVAAIRAQLERVVASTAFKSSKRCQRLLQRVVEHSFSANPEPLKERVLGAEVFGRSPQYDTANDPIVRVTAGEIRRRLGQYYADPAHQHELRIDLPTGHYAARYTPASADAAASGVAPSATAAGSASAGAGQASGLAGAQAGGEATALARMSRRIRIGRMVALAVVLIAALMVIPYRIASSSAGPPGAVRFWEPFWQSHQPILVCTGAIDIAHVSGRWWEAADAPEQPETSRRAAQMDAAPARPAGTPFVTVMDALALARVVALFQERAKPYRIRTDRDASFADLRASPTVLVGLFNNTWTMRLSSEFRYAPTKDAGEGGFLIRDRMAPARGWRPDRPWPDPRVQRDYGFISRVFDPSTGSLVVIAGGVTPYATVAAAELLTDAQHLEEALRTLPADWPSRNVQVVLETQILDGDAGPPHVIASHVW